MGHPGGDGQSESMPLFNPRMYAIQFCDVAALRDFRQE